jgi:hypothetical protein
VSVQVDRVAVRLARAVFAWTLNEHDVGIVESTLEVDRSAARLVEAAWVADVDGNALVLSASVIVIEGRIDVLVSRGKGRSCSGQGGEGAEDDGVLHDGDDFALELVLTLKSCWKLLSS